MKNNTFSIIGGDNRSVVAAERLCALGLDIHIFGFDADVPFGANIHREKTLADAVKKASYILLPLPCSSGNERLNTPLYEGSILLQDIASLITAEQMVFAGKMDPWLKDALQERHIACFDYADREEFAVLNAIPTAEGAVEIALRELSCTLNGSECLVIGFGRISKALSHCLRGMGARVTTSARRHSDLAWITSYGYTPIHTNAIKEQINKYQIIFNTVPVMILDRDILAAADKNCLIIDLASKPGGVDFESAERLGLKVIHALSLPGKVAPRTAGAIICDTVLNIISESEVKA